MELFNTNNLSKTHETRDRLAVPVRRLSWSISIHFVAIHSWSLRRSHKLQKKRKTTKKFITIACYDKQHACAYLQPFTCYTS